MKFKFIAHTFKINHCFDTDQNNEIVVLNQHCGWGFTPFEWILFNTKLEELDKIPISFLDWHYLLSNTNISNKQISEKMIEKISFINSYIIPKNYLDLLKSTNQNLLLNKINTKKNQLNKI